jgi:hypothetical protein
MHTLWLDWCEHCYSSVIALPFQHLMQYRRTQTPLLHVVVEANSSVLLHVPASFHGLLDISSAEGTDFSDGVQDQLTVFHETAQGGKTCFLGDWSEYASARQDGGNSQWLGDTVRVKGGRVKIQYIDEMGIPTVPDPYSVDIPSGLYYVRNRQTGRWLCLQQPVSTTSKVSGEVVLN